MATVVTTTGNTFTYAQPSPEHTTYEPILVEGAEVYELVASWYDSAGLQQHRHIIVVVDNLYICCSDASDTCKHVRELKNQLGLEEEV